ncbi:hypothetical protein PsorP6_001627 [Peronosclerospora sorghi]|uniref:Uncharacterized protein n=1 Tax=Peronosclerospora sorghi TaxID=230839 RepID=A0ACC0WSX2_9STRA|nr:hypothetical protein PsorP6_001627 [Peronosclerospora sorghi]
MRSKSGLVSIHTNTHRFPVLTTLTDRKLRHVHRCPASTVAFRGDGTTSTQGRSCGYRGAIDGTGNDGTFPWLHLVHFWQRVPLGIGYVWSTIFGRASRDGERYDSSICIGTQRARVKPQDP